jgi:hypothetical protein
MSETEYESYTDVELTTDHMMFLSKAGASDLLIDLLTFPKEAAGVSRHSAREEIKSYIFFGEFESHPTDFSPYGGHFFSAMWDGDLFGAWLRADFNNKSLLRKCFGESRIISAGIESNQPEGYVRRMVQEPAL